jgi:hypothetical protein
MLVWYERGDGRWEAPAASYRAERRWIEVGGGYAIRQVGGRPFDADYTDEGRRFSVSYRDNVLGDIMLGVRRTLGGGSPARRSALRAPMRGLLQTPPRYR